MADGYIKLSRKLLSSACYRQKPFDPVHAWIDIIYRAAYREESIVIHGKTVIIPRGCFKTTQRELAEDWGWSRGRLDRFLAECVTNKQIRIHSTKYFSLIEVLNYPKYQGKDTEPRTEPRTEPPTEPRTEPRTEPAFQAQSDLFTEPQTEPRTEPATEPRTKPQTEPVLKKKRILKEKPPKGGKKKVETFLFSEFFPEKFKCLQFMKTWRRWEIYRKERRKPMPFSTARMQWGTLRQYPVETACKMILQSIEFSYIGIFELRNTNLPNHRKEQNESPALELNPAGFGAGNFNTKF